MSRLAAAFGRLGLLARLVGIVLLLLLAVAAAGIGLSYASREAARDPMAGLPERIAAAVAALERAGPEGAEEIVRAVSGPDLALSLLPEMPPRAEGARGMPGAEWLLARRLGEARGLRVDRLARPRGPARLRAGPRVAAFVPLAGGRVARFALGARGANALFGVPVGFWIGAAGFLFAALAVWAIAREARPLRRLSASVAGFAADGTPRPVPERGAPEIRRLAAAVNAMQGRIAGLIRARTVLLGGIGHDLKTLVTRLRLRIEDIPEPERRARAEADLAAMTALLDDALAVARGAEGGPREPVDLAALAREEAAARPRAALAVGAAEPVRVIGAPAALRRLVANLLDNALRYGGRAAVSVAVAQGEAVLAVEDAGPGIPEALREEVFEPFVRLEASRSRETGGSGLGLAIVRQIAEAHGGRAEIGESAALGGARVAVRLPAAR